MGRERMYYVQPVLSPSRGSASFRLGAHGLRRGLYSVATSRLELAPRGKRLGVTNQRPARPQLLQL